MKILKFEYRISIAYLLIGGLWIIFSDKLLHALVTDRLLLTELQTYKGWFYVLVTTLFLFVFLKNHLNRVRFAEAELKKHKDNLQHLVDERTNDLMNVNNELKSTNKELSNKTEIINQQNLELKEALNTLKKTQFQLVQSEKMASLGTLTAGVAHEINNPLNYIMGAYVGLKNYFKKHGSSDGRKVDRLLNNMHLGIKRASDIVKGLDQINRGNINYNETCDINTTLDNCMLILENQLTENIEIVKIYSGKPIFVRGNIGNLHRAFINIISNAIDAIKEKKGQIKIKTAIDERWNSIEISDNGCGISKEYLSQITDPFFTTKPAGEGTGLGLSITYSIIREHNGVINFESEVDKGTKVSILLPVMDNG